MALGVQPSADIAKSDEAPEALLNCVSPVSGLDLNQHHRMETPKRSGTTVQHSIFVSLDVDLDHAHDITWAQDPRSQRVKSCNRHVDTFMRPTARAGTRLRRFRSPAPHWDVQ